MFPNRITTFITNLQALSKYMLLSMIMAFFLLSSCEEPEQIGFELQPQNDVGVFFSDTFTVEASTVLLDSIQTSGSFVLLAGNYNDSQFGNIQTRSYFELRGGLEDDNVLFLQPQRTNQSFTPTSLQLNLPVGYLYGDLTQTQTFRVYALADTIDIGRRYYNFDQMPTESTELGSIRVKGDTLEIGQVLSIQLDDNLRDAVFESARDSINTNTDFINNTLKGLAIVADDDTWLMGYNIIATTTASASLTLNLKYTETYDDGGGNLQTEDRNLFLTATSGRFSNTESSNLPSDLDNLETYEGLPTNLTNDIGFIQAGIGFRTKISFPHLKEQLNRLGNAVINRAEIVIKPQAGSDDEFETPRWLLLHEGDNSNRVLLNDNEQELVVQVEGSNPFGTQNPLLINFNERLLEYRGDITTHLQYIFTGIKENEELIITPGLNSNSTNRVLLNFDKNSPYSTKLRIFYTLFE